MKFRPSSSDRWTACPGSMFLFKGETPSNKYAIVGTAAHTVMEETLKGGDFTVSDDWDPVEVTCSVSEITTHVPVTDEMKESVDFALRIVQDQIDKLSGLDFELMTEKRYDHPELEGFGGTLDVVILVGEFAYVFDLKYGTARVRPDSKQMACYASLVRSVHPHVKYIRTTIMQPRCRLKTKTASYNWTAEELDGTIAELKASMQVAKDVSIVTLNDNLQTGKHCYYCPSRDECPARQRESAAKDFGG